jgi:lipopolysaccharide/colanic/teichoic acid biosynthesis glycosyltransferase
LFARLLLYGGIVLVVAGLGKLHAAEVSPDPYDFTGSSRFAWSGAYVVVLALAAYGVGLPDLTRSARAAFSAALAAAALGAAAISVVQLAVGDALLPRFVVAGAALVLVPWYVLCAAVSAGGRARLADRDSVVVVSSDPAVNGLASELERSPERPASLAAVVPVEEAAASGDEQPLAALVERSGASVIVLDRDAQAEPSVVRQVAQLHESGCRVRTLSLFYEQWLGKLPLGELERVSLMFDIGQIHRARYGRVKRLVDLAVAAALLPVLLVVVAVTLVGNLLGNRGPLLFRQERVGKGGEPFEILKLRTMRPSTTARWTAEDDERITGFGRVLRRTHLDELPQIVNILRGELAVVGPRPEQVTYVTELRQALPYYDLRHLVPPGLTGWAQVKYHYGADEADALEKLQYEFYYLRHQTLALDLRIMVRTLRTVLGREGR